MTNIEAILSADRKELLTNATRFANRLATRGDLRLAGLSEMRMAELRDRVSTMARVAAWEAKFAHVISSFAVLLLGFLGGGVLAESTGWAGILIASCCAALVVLVYLVVVLERRLWGPRAGLLQDFAAICDDELHRLRAREDAGLAAGMQPPPPLI